MHIMKYRIQRALAAVAVLAGCAAPQTPTAQSTPSAEPAKSPAPTAAGPAEGAQKVAGDDSAAADKRPGAEDQSPKQSSPAAPPAPEGAPPSWLAKATSPYRAGEAAQYLPKECRERIYIDAGSIVGPNAPDVHAFLDQLIKEIGSPREVGRITKALGVVHEAGADPVATWREIAGCRGEGKAFAIGFARDKPIELPLLVQKVKLALGDEPGVVTRKGDVSMLIAPDGEIFAQPSPSVLLVGRDKDAMLATIEKKAGAAGFAAARGELVFVKDTEGELTVKQTGDKIDVSFTAHLTGHKAEEMKKNPKEVTAKVETKFKSIADSMKGTPIEPLGERIRAVKIAVRGDDAVLTGSIQRSSIVSMLKKVSTSDLEKLVRALK